MINSNFVIIGALISFLSTLSYLTDTLKGKAKPNRVSWFVWALAPLVAFSAQLNKGVGIESLLTFMAGFNPLLVLIASFVNKKSYWKITKLDIFCGVLSIVGILFWVYFKEGNIAIFFGILADGLAVIPSLIKSFKFPETENYWIFLGGAINGIITLLAIKQWNFANAAFPLYIFFICVIFVILIKFKIGKRFF